jgi:hypothetical protein
MNLRKHIIEYSFIALYFAFMIYFFQNLGDSFFSKIIFAGALPVFYLLWSVVHHYFEDRLTFQIFLEYLSISLFVFIILLTASTL